MAYLIKDTLSHAGLHLDVVGVVPVITVIADSFVVIVNLDLNKEKIN